MKRGSPNQQTFKHLQLHNAKALFFTCVFSYLSILFCHVYTTVCNLGLKHSALFWNFWRQHVQQAVCMSQFDGNGLKTLGWWLDCLELKKWQCVRWGHVHPLRTYLLKQVFFLGTLATCTPSARANFVLVTARRMWHVWCFFWHQLC